MLADGREHALKTPGWKADSSCMRMPWQSKPKPESQPVERRSMDPEWCATCRSTFGPFVYLESGRHYCESCAEQIQRTMGLKVAERREGNDHLHSQPADSLSD